MASLDCTVHSLDENKKSPCRLSNRAGRLQLTGRAVEAQTGHKNSESRAEESPGFLLIVTGEEGTRLYNTAWPHHYMKNDPSRKKLLNVASTMEKSELPPTSVLIRHWSVQHAGAKWRGEH